MWGYLQAPPFGIVRRGGLAHNLPRRRLSPGSVSSKDRAAFEKRLRLFRLRPVERADPYLRPVCRRFQGEAVSAVFVTRLVGYHEISRVHSVVNNETEHEGERHVKRLYVGNASLGPLVLNVPQGSGAQANAIRLPAHSTDNWRRKGANAEWVRYTRPNVF